MATFDITQLEETVISSSLFGKIILLYGTNRTGKTMVASQLFPGRTLLVATEKGYNAIGGVRKVDIDSWGDFRVVVAQLTGKKKKEAARKMYDCVVVDVADRLPNLCNQYICQQMDVDNLADVPYGGGYAALNKEFDTQVNKLALSGYCVILICHDEFKVFNADTKDEYEMIIPKNTFSKAGNCLKDIPDFNIYLEPNGVDEEGHVILSTGHTALHKNRFFAGGRFPECPEKIDPFTAENLKEAIKVACERRAEALGVPCVDYAVVEEKNQSEESSKRITLSDMKNKIDPVFRKLLKEGYKESIQAIVERFLGEGGKVSKATESDLKKLQFIYDKLVDFAEENNVEWEESE